MSATLAPSTGAWPLTTHCHGDWRCVITTGHGAAAQTTTTTGATLALDYDQKATCTLAYEDLPRAKESRLTLVSVVNNRHGGTATADSVPLSASHFEAATSRTVTVSGNSGSSTITQPTANTTTSATTAATSTAAVANRSLRPRRRGAAGAGPGGAPAPLTMMA